MKKKMALRSKLPPAHLPVDTQNADVTRSLWGARIMASLFRDQLCPFSAFRCTDSFRCIDVARRTGGIIYNNSHYLELTIHIFRAFVSWCAQVLPAGVFTMCSSSTTRGRGMNYRVPGCHIATTHAERLASTRGAILVPRVYINDIPLLRGTIVNRTKFC